MEVVPSEECGEACVVSNVSFEGDLYNTDDNWVDVDDKKDEDYIPPDNVSEASSVKSDNVSVSFKELLRNDKLFLVYENKLYELLKLCPRCGNYLDKSLIEDAKNSGSQLHLKLNCPNGCNVEWNSQPEVESVNLFLAASIVFSGLPSSLGYRFLG